MTLPLSREGLERDAAKIGFEPATYEKVIRLLTLLNRITTDADLGPYFVLKGGTALNLFVFDDIPRLSVDIDLNYIGAPGVDSMRAARPPLEDRLSRLCQSVGLTPRRIATSHAGGKWILPYRNVFGTIDRVEIDLNYVLRVPLWDVQLRESVTLGNVCARNVAVLDEHELTGAKLVALLTRTASRDLFDAHHLFSMHSLDVQRLRLVTVVYGAMSNTDWRTVTVDQITVDANDVRQKLLPVLRTQTRRTATENLEWARSMIEETRAGLSTILPLKSHELDFITRVREHREIRADLLTDDPELRRRIEAQPMLRWRANQREIHAAPEEATQ